MQGGRWAAHHHRVRTGGRRSCSGRESFSRFAPGLWVCDAREQVLLPGAHGTIHTRSSRTRELARKAESQSPPPPPPDR